MPRGTIKWFNEKKGFGFIEDKTLNGDIFFHFSAIQMDGFRTLEKDDAVEYELETNEKGSRASKVMKL